MHYMQKQELSPLQAIENNWPHISYEAIMIIFNFDKLHNELQAIEDNWRGGKHNLQRINCRSENSKGVYCLQVLNELAIISCLNNRKSFSKYLR